MHSAREMETTRPSRSAVRWFALAVAALAIAGMFAVVLVLARVPMIASALQLDPALAQRSLVVHVNLATGVWFFAFIAGLCCLGAGARPRRGAAVAVSLATAGVIAFVLSALSGAGVVLSDYVPVIDHGLFLAGLAAFATGVVLATFRRTCSTSDAHALPPEVQQGLRASAIAFAIAMLTIAAAIVCGTAGASRLASFQHLFWGGGHVLQFAATAGMLAAWLLLVHQLVGRSAISSRLSAALFALLVLPTSIAPGLVLTRQHPRAFTRMMELGIFPVVIVVMVAGLMAVRRHGRRGPVHWPAQPVALSGLAVSVGMTLLGFALGAAIVGDTTLTPAHYHISIGAVTVSFMAAVIVLLPRFGAPVRWPRLAMWQPLIYGGGQTVFALGLAIAGFWGRSARKLYSAEQVVSAPAERIGWIVAGVGGLFAFAGGIAFVAIVVGSWQRGVPYVAFRSGRGGRLRRWLSTRTPRDANHRTDWIRTHRKSARATRRASGL